MDLKGMAASYVAFSVLHFLLFVMALVVCGLYGVDLHRADKANVYADPKWVYAEVVAGFSAITALLYTIPFILRFAFIWVWNTILFIFWITLFGIFGNMYIKEDPEGDDDIQRMKNAVWVVLVNALLWLAAALAAFGYSWRHRERQSPFTGRTKA